MGLCKQTKQALVKAIECAGNMFKLSKISGVNYAAISRFCSGKNDCKNMTLYTVERLFPDISVKFFREDQSQIDSRPPSDLDPVEAKVVDLMRNMTDSGRLELLAQAAVLRSTHLKNNENTKVV